MFVTDHDVETALIFTPGQKARQMPDFLLSGSHHHH